MPLGFDPFMLCRIRMPTGDRLQPQRHRKRSARLDRAALGDQLRLGMGRAYPRGGHRGGAGEKREGY